MNQKVKQCSEFDSKSWLLYVYLCGAERKKSFGEKNKQVNVHFYGSIQSKQMALYSRASVIVTNRHFFYVPPIFIDKKIFGTMSKNFKALLTLEVAPEPS